VMRWIYSEQVPSQNVNFGYGPANEVKRRLLTFWNSASFLVTYANIEGFRPSWEGAPRAERPLDRWLFARTSEFVARAGFAYERFWTPDVVDEWDSFVDDVSNWYIRRSRRRFYGDDEAAFSTLWWALVQAVRVIAPVMPFLAEHIWQNLVRGAEGAPDSVFLAGWPKVGESDAALLDEVAEVRRVVELGRKARDAARIKHRQPLRRLVVQGAPLAVGHTDEVREELRVKEVEFGDVEAQELIVKPHLPALGPKLGRELGAVRAALAAGEFEELGDGRFRAAGHELAADEVLVERRGREGWEIASDTGVTVALDTSLDDELRLEGQVLDLIHLLNTKRKEAGLELTDRITVTLPEDLAHLLAHEEWIKSEVLAVAIETDGAGAEPTIAKA
jgi:isoleucyl-tRNA synthetase